MLWIIRCDINLFIKDLNAVAHYSTHLLHADSFFDERERLKMSETERRIVIDSESQCMLFSLKLPFYGRGQFKSDCQLAVIEVI